MSAAERTDRSAAPQDGSGERRARGSFLPEALAQGVRKVAGRVSWGLGDQAMSSLTNFAVGVVVARSLSASEFGGFSLAWVTYALVLNVARGLATDPLVVRFSGDPDDRWRDAVRRSTGTAVVVGLAAGLVSCAVGLLVRGTVGSALIALGIVMPALMVQDAWRFAFFAAGHGRKAFVNDSVWALALIPGLTVAVMHQNVFAFVIAWGGAGTVAAAVGCWQARIVPYPHAITSWLRQHSDLGFRYLVENISQSGAAQIRMYGLGAVAGLAAVGTVRGGELLVGPFLALLMGLNMVAVPEAARVLRESPRRLPALCLALGGVQWLAALCWGLGLLLVLPDSVGAYLLGGIWPSAATLIVPASLSVMNAGLSAGASSGLRALGAARLSLRTQLIASAAYATFGVVGAWLGGAIGSSWGVVAATLLGTVLWWIHLHVGLRDHLATIATPHDADPKTLPIPAVFSDSPTVFMARISIDDATVALPVPPASADGAADSEGPVPHPQGRHHRT